MRAALVLAAACLLAACASAPTRDKVVVDSQVPEPIATELMFMGPVVDMQGTAALYGPLQQQEPYAGVRVERALRYGTDAERNVLDVFAPEAPGAPRPVLVFVHGGGFVGGERRVGDSPFYDNIALWAVKNGMVGVNTTYRLAPRHPWPAAQQDLAATIAWVRRNIAARGGDPKRIYLMGHSAGAAHVAQYVGHPELQLQPGGGIAGAIMVSGLYDPSTAAPGRNLQAYFGSNPALYPERSALPGMAASRLPMLLAYAELDPPEFQAQAKEAEAALCAAHRCAPLLELRGHTHMSEVYAINTADRALTAAIRAFVRP